MNMPPVSGAVPAYCSGVISAAAIIAPSERRRNGLLDREDRARACDAVETGRRLAGPAFRDIVRMGEELPFLPGDDDRTRPRGAI
jgi:hypothetical protein